MRRSDLEHLIRAAGRIAGERELVIIGSQSVLGQFPHAPVALLMSMEADLYPRAHPELADKVDGAIGEGSAFHQAHGYYAQGVGPGTATLPFFGIVPEVVDENKVKQALEKITRLIEAGADAKGDPENLRQAYRLAAAAGARGQCKHQRLRGPVPRSA